ncbi:MAG: M28 family peptidase [Chitinophagaceae bacterium]
MYHKILNTILNIKKIIALLFFLSCIQPIQAQLFGSRASASAPAMDVETDIEKLCTPATNGRYTGSMGETNAANYIESRFNAIGIKPYQGKYKWDFTCDVGMQLGENAKFEILGKNLKIGNDILFLPYGSGNKISGMCLPRVNEKDNVWLIPLSDTKVIETNDIQKRIYDFAKSSIEGGARAVIFLNDINTDYDLNVHTLRMYDVLTAPVGIINFDTYTKQIQPQKISDWIDVNGTLDFDKGSATGKNIMAYIDNKAALTMVIGTHYDHLGNTFTGADKGASGVAAMLQIAESIKKNRLSNYNYLFVAFSGHEQNLAGSKAFFNQYKSATNSIAGFIELDMLGRLNSSKELLINGAGTSPSWIPTLQTLNKGYKLLLDSSGVGFSEFTNFYYKNIPSIRISTGYHTDFNKQTDVPQKIMYTGLKDIINYVYTLIADMDTKSKPVFTKTNDYLIKLQNIETDLGIIPDNTYENNGIRVGACLPYKAAEKAGIVPGDIIAKIGSYIIVDMYDYIEAITKSDKGKETVIIIKRDKNEFKFFVTL